MMKKNVETLRKMRYTGKKQNGITLIALVVTIIVLLILAGISINMLTGQNGILSRAKDAKNSTEDASDLEFLQMKAYEAVTGYYMNSETGSESDYVLKELKNVGGVTANTENGTLTYNGKTYNISDIMGNSIEQKTIEKAGLNQVTAANVTDPEDKKILEEKDENQNTKIRMIIVEETTDKGTVKAVIPSGFYYVAGTPSTGLVISDKFEDDNENSKGGNQFVWVPCDGTTLTYAKHIYETANADDNGNSSVPDTGNGKWPTYYYRKWDTVWSDSGDREIKNASVEKYKGFYVGRYEAGEPTNAAFYNDTNGSTYWQSYYSDDVSEKYGDNTISKPDSSKTYKDTYKSKNVNNLLPVSKKNTPSWNLITQANAKTVSENMYGNSKTVKSYLIDGVAWDTITNWIADEGKDVTNSVNYGNYLNTHYTINGLYARHEYKKANDNNYRWFPAYVYNKGVYGKTTDERIEIATGSNEISKTRNIYDMAGNMWEWTTETGTHDGTTFAVLRGGGFVNYGSYSPVSYRYGHNSASSYYSINIGFRVVLYIK